MRSFAVLTVLCAALAGCATPAEEPPTLPDLFGAVRDSTGGPLASAVVGLLDTDVTTTSDADGAFTLDVGGREGPVTAFASLDGFLTQHAHVVLAPGLAVRVGFTLRTFEEIGGLSQTIGHTGYLPCDSYLASLRQPTCPFIGDRRDRLEITLDDGVVPVTGLLVEVDWTEPAGQSLRVEVRDGDEVLGAQEGVSPLRLLVPQADVQRPAAEIVVAPASGSVFVNQPFSLWATVFYVEAPPAGFSATA